MFLILMKSRVMRGSPITAGKNRSGFTLLETLVVIAIIGVLASLLLPALALSKETAKVARVRAELYGIGLALDMYATDNGGQIPPVRVNCNTDLRFDWCELPVELANQRYLPHGPAGLDADLEDVFNPQHTYKYAAPGPQLLNGSPTANYALWEPTNLATMSGGGQYFTDPKLSPIRWVVWSLGPQPDSPKAQDTYAPLNRESWYTQAGDTGVIARYAKHDGTQFITH
jgi:prepilin-type N-terminal cleavage/methylation domain-containing protein